MGWFNLEGASESFSVTLPLSEYSQVWYTQYLSSATGDFIWTEGDSAPYYIPFRNVEFPVSANRKYKLRVVGYFEKGKIIDYEDFTKEDYRDLSLDADKAKIIQDVIVDGVKLGRMELIEEKPETLEIILPLVYNNGKVMLEIDKKRGRFATVSLYRLLFMSGRRKDLGFRI